MIPDSGCVALDWLHDSNEQTYKTKVDRLDEKERCKVEESVKSKPIVVMLPGLAGGSNDAYVRHFVLSAAKKGFTPVVFNARGCAESPVTTPKFYSASYTGDLRFVINTLRLRFPDSMLFAVGWSLGANILINYLAEEGDKCCVTAAASIGNPFNLEMCSKNLERPGIYKIYDGKLAQSLRTIFNR